MIAAPAIAADAMAVGEAEIERRKNHRDYRFAFAGLSPAAVRLSETKDRGG
jgi:hypothetical protein